MKRPELKDYPSGGDVQSSSEAYQNYCRDVEKYIDYLEAKVHESYLATDVQRLNAITVFLKDYFALRKRQEEFFKKRSQAALIFCKENEPLLDAKATELYKLLTEPTLPLS